MANIKCTFDAATVADAIQKASRVAPHKGAAFDMAQGLCFEVDPPRNRCVLKATNLDITYLQRLNITDAKGDPTMWRIPSTILTGLVSNLPLGSGNVITFVDTGDGAIRILSGTVAVKLRMIDGVFPTIEPFDNAGLADSGDFSQRVSQVAWAVARDSSILSGVHVDGHHLIACDRQVAALIPCVVPLPRPVTVPLTAISSILKNASDVRIGATDRNLLIQLDQETQATTKLYEGAYPDVKALKRADFIGKVNLPRTQMVEAISRMMVVAKSERLPVIKMTLNYGIVKSCVLDLQVADTGHRIQDTLDVTGDFSDPFEIFLSPAMLVNALENARDESVLMEFGHSDPTKTSLASIRFTDTKDYEVLLQPRKP